MNPTRVPLMDRDSTVNFPYLKTVWEQDYKLDFLQMMTSSLKIIMHSCIQVICYLASSLTLTHYMEVCFVPKLETMHSL